MPEFDPYHRWLSISPEEQPPNHYRLLGVKLFESDADAIESAADRQMAHVRSFQTGKHAAWSQKLLNELSVAKHCLLSSAQKADYDRELRARMPAAAPPAAKPAIVVAKPLPTAKPLIAAAREPARQVSGTVAGIPAGIGFDPLDHRGPVRRTTPKKSALTMPVLTVGGVGLAIAVVAAWIVLGDRSGEPLDGKVQPVAAAQGPGQAKAWPTEAPAERGDTARSRPGEAAKGFAADSGGDRPAGTCPDDVPMDESSAPPEHAPADASSPPGVAESNAPADEPRPETNQPTRPEQSLAVDDAVRVGGSGLADADEQARITSEIKETFADDYARAKSRDQKASLARKLLAEARKAGDPEMRSTACSIRHGSSPARPATSSCRLRRSWDCPPYTPWTPWR